MDKRGKITTKEFIRRYPDNKSAQTQFEEWRWRGTKRCAYCDGVRISRVRNQETPYQCKDCKKRFSVRTGTIMSSNNSSYLAWLAAVHIATTGLKEVKCEKFARDLGIAPRSVRNLAHRLCEAEGNGTPPFSKLKAVNGAYDQNKVGAGRARKSPRARVKAGGKTAIASAKHRNVKKVRGKIVKLSNQTSFHGFA